jgi:hypothetical protein
MTCGAVIHKSVAKQGIIDIRGCTITLTGTPAFTYYAAATRMGTQMVNNNTYTGSATGQRYIVNGNAVVDTNGGGANYLPGNSAGATSTGGQYL